MDEFQSTFIPGRSILDSVALAEEAITFLKERHDDKLLVKINFEKTFDTLDGGFLLEALKAIGMSHTFCGWINE